jgi:hypothetical protein
MDGDRQEEQFRFLYFNHMNLALKTSLSANKSSPLTMDTIKLIRSIHAGWDIFIHFNDIIDHLCFMTLSLLLLSLFVFEQILRWRLSVRMLLAYAASVYHQQVHTQLH